MAKMTATVTARSSFAIFYGTVNNVNVASRFVNVIVNIAVAVIFAIVWTPPKAYLQVIQLKTNKDCHQ